MTNVLIVGTVMFATGVVTGMSINKFMQSPSQTECDRCIKYKFIVENLNKTIDSMIINFKKIHTYTRVLPSSTLSLVIDHLLSSQLRGD